MTQCVTLCMTQNLGATLLKIGVYDTKMYDTKCKTNACINLMFTLSSGSNACIALRSVVAADIKYSCLEGISISSLVSSKEACIGFGVDGW